jgi:hypothetical protein
MKRLASRFYQITPVEAFSITISATGTGFQVVASVDNTVLGFVDGVPKTITPEMLNGAGSYHDIHIHLFFTQGATKNSTYRLKVEDALQKEIESIGPIGVDAGAPLPQQEEVPITIVVAV